MIVRTLGRQRSRIHRIRHVRLVVAAACLVSFWIDMAHAQACEAVGGHVQLQGRLISIKSLLGRPVMPTSARAMRVSLCQCFG